MKGLRETQRFAMSMTIVLVIAVTALCFSDVAPGVSEFLSLRRRVPSHQIVGSADVASTVLQPAPLAYAGYIVLVLVAAVVLIIYLGRVPG